jgi:hypothetical protein
VNGEMEPGTVSFKPRSDFHWPPKDQLHGREKL